MSNNILVGFANDNEQNIPLEIIEKWEPKKISFLGDTVFFKTEENFVSMKKINFCDIFKEKCGKIKY
jgi:hypothetical protein